MMEFFDALMNTDPAHLAIGFFAVFAVFGMGGSTQEEEDDNSDYENASWNPSSVNYDG